MTGYRPFLPTIVLGCAALMAVIAYWVGLYGPFLLDDAANLRNVPDWLAGALGLRTLLFERGGGTFGRPLSMASFAFNAWIGGYTPFSLKVGNLITHLLCGLATFGFLRHLLRHDPWLRQRAPWYAGIVASLWLLHPLHVSTVLYVVQRMAQLSTLLILIGLWLYLVSRERLQRGPSLSATAGLLLGVPTVTVLAFLAKENGALLPLLCLVVEMTYFTGMKRPRPVRAFHFLYVLFPFALGLIAFALKPGRIVDGYLVRDFSLGERLLSQGRALCDYIWKLVVPNPPRMGVYTDDFAVSTGLMHPPATLAALVVLAGISVAAWRWRKRQPAIFFGWYFFMVAHALEAGPIPLELYFEHRNYLPSLGLLLALVSLVVAAGQLLARHGLRPGPIGAVTLVAVMLLLAAGTHGRARVWSDPVLIAESSLRAHPQSLRANAYMLGVAIDYRDIESVNQILNTLLHSPHPRNRSMGHLYQLYVDCLFKQEGNPANLEAFVTQTPLPLTRSEVQPFNALYAITAEQGCGKVTDQMLGAGLARLADRATAQPDPWRMRYQAASFLVRAKDWPAALTQAQLAWQSGAEPPVVMPLILARLHVGDIDGAEQAWQEANQRADPSNTEEQGHLHWLRERIEATREQVGLDSN